MKQESRLIAASLVLAAGMASAGKDDTTMSLKLTSSAFEAGQLIPAVHTCEGNDTSPPLSWSGLPPDTKSLALIVDDPDAPDPAAPQRTWVHWVVYNIPASATGLPTDVRDRDLPPGARIGSNDWRRAAYGGPCPPIGKHRYFFKLYALDTVLPDLGKPNKASLEKAMDGHILASTELIGLYQKQR
ncbi:MAG TPA: YbhB/YbcL family Raf kinase inhibitor-like protein [Noviherbaspirillum sp.]